MTVPPMVGVPFFDRCDSGPSSRISWPKTRRRGGGAQGARHRRPEEGGAARGGRALLRQVRLGAVVADLLAEAAPPEGADGQRCGEDRDEEPERRGDEDGLHAPAPVGSPVTARRSTASTSSPFDRLAFTSTTSPGTSTSESRSRAAARSGTETARVPAWGARPAPGWAPAAAAPVTIPTASGPTPTSRSTPEATASRAGRSPPARAPGAGAAPPTP